MMKTGFIGAGKVGCTLGKFLSIHGAMITGYYDRDTTAAEEAAQFCGCRRFDSAGSLTEESEIIFITVPDGLISSVFEEVRRFDIQNKYVCHCSGSISSEEAFAGIEEAGAFGYSVHPLFAVSDRFETYRELADAFFALEGDPRKVGEIRAFLSKAGLNVQTIDPASKTKYHLAAVYASNLICALLGQSVLLLRECGFGEDAARQAIAPLVRGNVEHALAAGPVQALTGPVERGDLTTIRKHLAVCESEEDRRLYRLLSRRLLKLAKDKHPERDYAELEEFLKDE